MEHCNNCKFYHVGFCRRHAPSLNRGVSVCEQHPHVDYKYWCGEWRSIVDKKLHVTSLYDDYAAKKVLQRADQQERKRKKTSLSDTELITKVLKHACDKNYNLSYVMHLISVALKTRRLPVQ